MNDYEPAKNSRHRKFWVLIDTSNQVAWTTPLKNKCIHAIINDFSKKRKLRKVNPIFLKLYDCKEYVNKNFKDLLEQNNIKRCSRYSSKMVVFAEKFDSLLRNFLKNSIFENGNASWIPELPSIIKKYNDTIHHITKVEPTNASEKSKERTVCSNLHNKRQKPVSKIKLGDLVRVADIEKVLSRRISTSYRYESFTGTQKNRHNSLIWNKLNTRKIQWKFISTNKVNLRGNQPNYEKGNFVEIRFQKEYVHTL